MSYDFYKTYEGDAVFYWYDITQHIQRVFGEDIVEKAYICLGHGYNDDSEDEIERLYCKLECSVRDIELKMKNKMCFYFDYSQDVKVFLKNKKTIFFTSSDGCCLEGVSVFS